MKTIHYLLPDLASKEVIKVVVVGAGGTGSQMLSGLANIAYGLLQTSGRRIEVSVYDDDEVSPTNVGRQMFYPCDIGQNKAQVLVQRINHGYGFNWKAHPFRISDKEDGSRYIDCDILISCVDSAASRRDVVKQVRSKYWLDLGNSAHTGQFVLGTVNAKPGPTLLPNAFDLFPKINDVNFVEDDTPSCSMAESLSKQSMFVNRTLAAHALSLLWELFYHGQIDHSAVFMDNKSGRVTPLSISTEDWARFGFEPIAQQDVHDIPY